MTACYNSNAYGFTDQIMDDLMKPLMLEVLRKRREVHPFAHGKDRNGFGAAKYLGRLIEDAILANLDAATEAMEFFKACVNACSAKGKHFQMRSPLNFPFVQGYKDYRRVKIKPSMYSRGVWKRVQVTLLEADNDNEPPTETKKVVKLDTAPINKKDSENAISANLTHMADACHMQMTIAAAKREGIDNLMMIHDSFATTAADMPVLFDIVRDMFVALYEEYDPFEAVLEATDYLVNYDDDGNRIPPFVEDEYGNLTVPNPDYTVLPTVPKKRGLEIKQVTDGWYSFI